MITTNCYSIALLTKLVLQNFKQRWAQRKVRSLVVNHTSAAQLKPMPYIQMYSATKVFQDFLNEGWNYEFQEFGIDVLGIKSFGLKPNLKLA